MPEYVGVLPAVIVHVVVDCGLHGNVGLIIERMFVKAAINMAVGKMRFEAGQAVIN